jgi:hypothetical protein
LNSIVSPWFSLLLNRKAVRENRAVAPIWHPNPSIIEPLMLHVLHPEISMSSKALQFRVRLRCFANLTTLRMTFKTAASAFYSRARYHSDARIPSGEMMEEVRSDTARSSKLLKIEIRISLHVSQNNASSMPVTLVVSVILDLDRPRRGVIRENVAPLENLRLTLR